METTELAKMTISLVPAFVDPDQTSGLSGQLHRFHWSCVRSTSFVRPPSTVF